MPTGPALTLLLPPAARLRQDTEACSRIAASLARADEAPAGSPGRGPRLRAWFDTGRDEPAAAPLTRTLDARDAAEGRWLRADPAHVAADLTQARLLACGGLGLAPDECAAFERALKPLFGDAGFEFSAPHPDRWYLRLPLQTELPRCSPPEQALGADLADHLPQGDAGARFRHLLNEAQVLLHQHPSNQRRTERDLVAVNSLWFWGGGALPARVKSMFRLVASIDPVLAALAGLGGASCTPARTLAELPEVAGAVLADVQELDAVRVQSDWFDPALAALRSRALSELRVALPDGRTYVLEHAHRWRFWRRANVLA